jgi:uncharacterized protein involved in tolerance to divalent cations
MMSLTLISNNAEQAEEIARYLLIEQLVIEANLIENTTCFRLDKDKQVVRKKSVALICTTKSLLFNKIDECLKEMYGKDMPVLYSVPIINMDWEQSQLIIEGTETV